MKLPESKRFILREFEESDWVAVHVYASHLGTVQYMDWGPNSEEDTKAFIKLTLESQKQNPRTNYVFAVVDRTSNSLIGTVGIQIEDLQSLVGAFGYILRSDYWGRGFGSEIARGIVDFGFQQLGLNRIWATCRPQNVASARVLEKAGLKCDGYLRENKWIRGAWADSHLYAITRSDLKSSVKSGVRTPRNDSGSGETITIRQARSEEASHFAQEERSIASEPGHLVSKPHELVDEGIQHPFMGTIEDFENLENLENLEHEDEQYSNLLLANASLVGHTFENCLFSKCNLNGADLSKSRFISCKFVESDLSNIIIRNCRIRDTSFFSSKLIGIQWIHLDDFVNPSFDQCILKYSNFSALKMKKTSFFKCDLEDVECSQADFSESDFREANLLKARFSETNLIKADFRGAINYSINPLANKLKGARFSLPEAQRLLSGLGIIFD